MKSKQIIISGLLASLLLIFLCIFMNVERYYHEMNLYKKNVQETTVHEKNSLVKSPRKSEQASSEKKALTEAVTIPDFSSDRVQNIETDENSVIKTKTKVETSHFVYKRIKNEESITGTLPLLEDDNELKEFIAHCAKSNVCNNNVTFIDNEETLSWKNLMVAILKFIYQEKIDNTQITVKNNELLIEGEFKNRGLKERFFSLVSDYDTGYKVLDKSTIYVQKQEKLVNKTPIKEVAKKKVNDINETMLLEEKIAQILKTRPITFQKNKGAIRLSGRKTLNEIAKLLLGKDQFLIFIEGHTDAGGKAKINMMISKVRARSVKHYLIKKGLKEKQIKAKGYGETKLLSSKNPYSKLNRRVEIHLKELK